VGGLTEKGIFCQGLSPAVGFPGEFLRGEKKAYARGGTRERAGGSSWLFSERGVGVRSAPYDSEMFLVAER